MYGISVAAAAPQDPPAATATVTTSNTQDNPYTSITVSGDDAYGISNTTTADVNIYLADNFTELKVTSNNNESSYAIGIYTGFRTTTTIKDGKAVITSIANSSEGPAWAYGVDTINGGTTKIGNLSATVTAEGGEEAQACGLCAEYGTNTVTGDVAIKAKATVPDGKRFNAYSLYASGARAGFYNLRFIPQQGVNDLSSTGTLKILEGDVHASYYGVNKLTLDTAGSYLQGNITNIHSGQEALGLNTVKVSNGAVWRPVFDNRYGTDCPEQMVTFYGMQQQKPASYKVAERETLYDTDENCGTVLTLENNGIIDLTWDGWSDAGYDIDRSYRMDQNQTEKFRKLTVANMTGAGGILKVDSNLANNEADQLILGSASTATSLKVQVNYDDFYADSVKGDTVTGKALVVTDNSAATTLASVTGTKSEYNEKTYEVTVEKDADDTTKWNLVKIEDVTEPKPTPTPEPVTPHITENTKHAADARDNVNNIWFVEMNSLRKRLGDLRSMEQGKDNKHDNLWAKFGHGTQSMDSGRNTDLQYNQFQIGYDKAFPQKNGKTYRGVLISRINGDASYERGAGDTNSTTVGLYQTWLGDKGHYYDIVLKAGKIDTDYNVTDLSDNYSDADYSMWGTALSGEYGYKRALSHGAYIEPSAELIFSHIGSADYSTSKNMDVYLDATKYAITRLGVTLGKEFNKGNIYFKGNYYHNFAGGGGVTTGDIRYQLDHPENWWEFGIGGDVMLTKNCSAYGEVKKMFGDVKSNVNYSVGARWSF